MRKPVNVIVEFDDIEYTDAERDLLWGRFFMELVKLQDKQNNQKQQKGKEIQQCKIY